jgi:tripartite-type tricarboxylate transporter receptor subunit TctC
MLGSPASCAIEEYKNEAAGVHAKSGRVRVIAITSAQRADALPNIPTAIEAGRWEL